MRRVSFAAIVLLTGSVSSVEAAAPRYVHIYKLSTK